MGINMSQKRKIAESYHAINYQNKIYNAKIVLKEEVLNWKSNYNFSYLWFNIQFDGLGSINIETTRDNLEDIFASQNSLFNMAVTVEHPDIANKKLIKKLTYALWRQKRCLLYVECFGV